MVTETKGLRAAIFERTGIAVDEDDPLMAVLAISAEQTEEIGGRLLARMSPARITAAVTTTALVFALSSSSVTWYVADLKLQHARSEWIQQQADPRMVALLDSKEGKAGLRLAELGVAKLLADCSGRRSWRIEDGYCVPMTSNGRPDGFRVRTEVQGEQK